MFGHSSEEKNNLASVDFLCVQAVISWPVLLLWGFLFFVNSTRFQSYTSYMVHCHLKCKWMSAAHEQHSCSVNLTTVLLTNQFRLQWCAPNCLLQYFHEAFVLSFVLQEISLKQKKSCIDAISGLKTLKCLWTLQELHFQFIKFNLLRK